MFAEPIAQGGGVQFGTRTEDRHVDHRRTEVAGRALDAEIDPDNGLYRRLLRCKGEAVSAVSDTAFPGPGVASTGLRRVWRHGGSRYLLHLGVTF
jgi:hypothetical protein